MALKRKFSTRHMNGPSMSGSIHPGGVRLRNRELIKDIQVSANDASFNKVGWLINPGENSLARWLPQLATLFTVYKWHYLRFDYVTTSGQGATDNAVGFVGVAHNPNPSDQIPTDKQSFCCLQGAVLGSANRNWSCRVDLSHMTQPYYWVSDVRIKNISDQSFSAATATAGVLRTVLNFDRREYDTGQFVVCWGGQGNSPSNPSSEQTDGITLGELYMTYDVELWRPNVPTMRWAAQIVSQDNPLNAHYSGTSVSNTNVLGTSWTQRYDSFTYASSQSSSVVNANYNGTLFSAATPPGVGLTFTATSITFPVLPAGLSFQVLTVWVGTAVATAIPSISFTNGATGPSDADNESISYLSNSGDTTGKAYSINYITTGSSTLPLVVSYSGGTLPTSAVVDVYITGLPSNYA